MDYHNDDQNWLGQNPGQDWLFTHAYDYQQQVQQAYQDPYAPAHPDQIDPYMNPPLDNYNGGNMFDNQDYAGASDLNYAQEPSPFYDGLSDGNFSQAPHQYDDSREIYDEQPDLEDLQYQFPDPSAHDGVQRQAAGITKPNEIIDLTQDDDDEEVPLFSNLPSQDLQTHAHATDRLNENTGFSPFTSTNSFGARRPKRPGNINLQPPYDQPDQGIELQQSGNGQQGLLESAWGSQDLSDRGDSIASTPFTPHDDIAALKTPLPPVTEEFLKEVLARIAASFARSSQAPETNDVISISSSSPPSKSTQKRKRDEKPSNTQSKHPRLTVQPVSAPTFATVSRSTTRKERPKKEGQVTSAMLDSLIDKPKGQTALQHFDQRTFPLQHDFADLTPEQVEDWLARKSSLHTFVKFKIPNDDIHAVSQATILNMCKELFDAIDGDPAGPPYWLAAEDWDDFSNRHQDQFIEVQRKMRMPAQRIEVSIQIKKLLDIAQRFHTRGMPEIDLDLDGYTDEEIANQHFSRLQLKTAGGMVIDTTSNFTARIYQIVEIVKNWKWVTNDLVDGKNLVDLVASPSKYLHRKIQNNNSNQKREKAKAEGRKAKKELAELKRAGGESQE